MKTVSDYEVVRFEDLETLIKEVKNGLFKGWQPYGKLMITGGCGDEDVYAQVMVKYED